MTRAGASELLVHDLIALPPLNHEIFGLQPFEERPSPVTVECLEAARHL